MIVAKVDVFATKAKTVYSMPIPAGLKGGEIRLKFKDPVWDGMIKLYVFNAHREKALRVLPSGEVEIPTEELIENQHLRFGVYGTDAKGTTVIPTIWADLGIVQPAADPGQDPGLDPDLPVWVQVLQRIGDLTELTTLCKTNLVCAINEIKKLADHAVDVAEQVRREAASGQFDGVSPTAKVEDAPGGVLLEVNDRYGTTSQVIRDGKDGKDGKDGAVSAYAICHDPAAPTQETANTWYVTKDSLRPTGEVGMVIDVLWQHGREDGLGYDVNLVYGSPDGPDNETILSSTGVSDNLTGEYGIPTEGTVRYQLIEQSGRLRWLYVSGPLLSKQFSSAARADLADKVVPGLNLEYLPGMDIYIQLDSGNAAPVMRLVPDAGPTLPVYGNGTGQVTGEVPPGYILHLKNAGDHWQIINSYNSGGGGGSDVTKTYVDAQDVSTLMAAEAYADGKLVTIDVEMRGPDSFWTKPIKTAQEIIDMVNAGKEVRLHFFDTITNTGDQLYGYETTTDGVPIFRRNVITADKAERINIGVQYNGEVKFEKVPYNPAPPIGFIWTSANPTSPATIYPGTFWEKIENVMLLGASARHPAGSTGGAETVSLTEAQNGLHTHNILFEGLNGNTPAFTPGTEGGNYGTIGLNKTDDTYTKFSKSSGSGAPHENMPPYLAVYMWQRIEKPEV